MAELTIVRGLPGSGKTTWAKAQKNAWRVNRDDIRAQYTGVWDYNDRQMENLVTTLQSERIKELLEKDCHVIVDDVNLDWTHVQLLIRLATSMRSRTVVVQVKEFLHVPVLVCIARDAQRPNPVGEDVIRGMYRKYMGGEDA